MKLKELLTIILQVAEKNKLSRPWIVGGLPRDKVLGREAEFKDLDLSTGDRNIHAFGPLLLKPLEQFHPKYEVLSDGHGRMNLGQLQIDFSNHFIIPGIENYSKANSSMLQELYSRDFFCNTLLLDIELSQIYDPSGEGISDIKKKEIRTCLDPKITFGYDPKRIVRAIYLAAKLGFQVEEKTKRFMIQNPQLLQQVSSSYLVKKISKALKNNPQLTIQLLKELNYWKHLPATPELTPYIQGNLL